MDRIHYAGVSFLTGTDIARALLDYAQALAQVGGAATIDIPTVNDDTSRGRSQFLVGPSSQLVSREESWTGDEVEDLELVAYLYAEASRLRSRGVSSPAAAITEPEKLETWTEYGV